MSGFSELNDIRRFWPYGLDLVEKEDKNLLFLFTKPYPDSYKVSSYNAVDLTTIYETYNVLYA